MSIHDNADQCQRIFTFAHGDIILLHPGEKRPVHDDWVRLPSMINGDARGYLSLGYNLGYRIPPGVLVLDVDPRNGGAESFALLPDDVQALPHTTITASGGWHIYLTLPSGYDHRKLKSRRKDLPGLDFLHYGKQVVLPGSRLSPSARWQLSPSAVFPPPAIPNSLLALLERPVASPGPTELNSPLSTLELELVLSQIPVERYRDNDTWLRLAMACHHGTAGEGLPVFLAWSTADPMYSDQSEIIRRRWESMSSDNTDVPVTIRTLVKELGQYGTVPTWLAIRAGLQQTPAEFFGTVEESKTIAGNAYEVLQGRISACGDQLTLLTTIAAEVGMESSITESLREILLKQIAVKTGASVAAIRKDIRLLSAPKWAGAGPVQAATNDQQDHGGKHDEEAEPTPPMGDGDMSQPHTTAAQSALAVLSADGQPPAFCFGKWLRWDKQRWADGRAAVDVKREAHKALYNQGTPATGGAIRSVVEIMETMMEVPPATFAAHRERVRVFTPFHVLDYTLSKGWQVSSPDPANRNLIVTGAVYNPEAPAPTEWLKTLNEVLTSDHARRTVACMIIYSAAQCRPWLRKAFYLYGPKRSGKSTILDTVQALLGAPNCSALNVRQLGSRFGGSGLVGKLANISNETVSSDTLQDDVFKALVSGETVTVEAKYAAQFELRNTAKLLFAANGFPRVTDESDATWDRLTILSCPESRPRAQCDPLLGERLQAPESLSGILNWALPIFAEEYAKDKCTSIAEMDDEARECMESWQEVNNPAIKWVSDRTRKAATGVDLDVSYAYADYKQWCYDCGHRPLNKIHFSRQAGRLLAREKVSGVAVFADRELTPVSTA